MMANSMKTLKLHHPLFQFLIIYFIFFQLYGAKVIGLGVGATNTINLEAFEILTGRKDRHFILQFKKSNSCSGDDESDCECSESEDDGDEDEGDGGCGNSELKRAVNLICG